MDQDLVASVEIANDGSLHVAPATREFPHAYREAMEVTWDAQRRSLQSPPPREWSYGRWLQQIVSVAASQGVRLVFHSGTSWEKVPAIIRPELLEAAGHDA